MSPVFNWNKRPLGRFSLFNRTNMPCAVLQGGVFFGMFIAASRVLIDPKANYWEISHSFTTLTLVYGALGEKPLLWSFLFYLFLSSKNRDKETLLTLPKELHLGMSTLSIISIFRPLIGYLNESEDDFSPAPVNDIDRSHIDGLCK